MRKYDVYAVLPYYVVGLFWIVYGISFPLYRVSDFMISAGISVMLFIVLKRILPQPVRLKKTGDASIDEIAAKGAEAIAEMRRLNALIPDEKLSALIDELEYSTNKIIQFLMNNTDAISGVKTFFNYYLPTTIKLLNSYHELSGQESYGENITSSISKIERVMGVIVKAFKKQLDDLYIGKAMDISAEIKIMEFTIQSEGLKPDGK